MYADSEFLVHFGIIMENADIIVIVVFKHHFYRKTLPLIPKSVV